MYPVERIHGQRCIFEYGKEFDELTYSLGVRMRTIASASLCILLMTGCAGLAVTAENHSVGIDNSPQLTNQPSISSSLVSGVPLYLWNESLSHYEIHLVDPETGADVPDHAPIVVSGN